MEPVNCRRCGKAVLAGEIDGLSMQIDTAEVPYADALVLWKHKLPLVRLLLRSIAGTVQVAAAGLVWQPVEDDGAWVTVQPHRCGHLANYIWGG